LGRSRQQIFSRDLKPEDRRKLLHELASRESFAAALGKEGLSGGAKCSWWERDRGIRSCSR
jgi:hypothetical protein